MRAAEVLGYSRVQTFLYIVMPRSPYSAGDGQRDHHAGQDTSLAFAIGVGEIFTRRPRRWSPRR